MTDGDIRSWLSGNSFFPIEVSVSTRAISPFRTICARAGKERPQNIAAPACLVYPRGGEGRKEGNHSLVAFAGHKLWCKFITALVMGVGATATANWQPLK